MQTAPASISTDGRGLDTPSFVAWSAIVAGAMTIAAVALVLLLLGSGFGLAAVSPWANSGVSVTTFTVGAAIWLIIMQWVASALGGYLTGRLRHRWTNMHKDEVFFRDTAHGFLAWVLAALVTAAFLSSAVALFVGGDAHVATAAALGAPAGAGYAAAQKHQDCNGGPMAYFVDSLYRPSDAMTATTSANSDVRGETSRILMTDMKAGNITDADKKYLAELVASHTGLSPADAQSRVGEVVVQMKAASLKTKEEADAARKAASALSFYSFLSLLIGAFIAATAAALGGSHRDD